MAAGNRWSAQSFVRSIRSERVVDRGGERGSSAGASTRHNWTIVGPSMSGPGFVPPGGWRAWGRLRGRP